MSNNLVKFARSRSRSKSASSHINNANNSDLEDDINVSTKRWSPKDTTFLVEMIKNGKIKEGMSPTQVCMKYRERLRKYSVRQVRNCLQRIKQKGGKGLSEDYGEFEFLGFFINVYLHVI